MTLLSFPFLTVCLDSQTQLMTQWVVRQAWHSACLTVSQVILEPHFAQPRDWCQGVFLFFPKRGGKGWPGWAERVRQAASLLRHSGDGPVPESQLYPQATNTSLQELQAFPEIVFIGVSQSLLNCVDLQWVVPGGTNPCLPWSSECSRLDHLPED